MLVVATGLRRWSSFRRCTWKAVRGCFLSLLPATLSLSPPSSFCSSNRVSTHLWRRVGRSSAQSSLLIVTRTRIRPTSSTFHVNERTSSSTTHHSFNGNTDDHYAYSSSQKNRPRRAARLNFLPLQPSSVRCTWRHHSQVRCLASRRRWTPERARQTWFDSWLAHATCCPNFRSFKSKSGVSRGRSEKRDRRKGSGQSFPPSVLFLFRDSDYANALHPYSCFSAYKNTNKLSPRLTDLMAH